MSNLKKYLDLYLENHNISQKDFAESIEIAPNRLSQWANDKRQPDNDSWILLSQKLNIPIDDLMGNEKFQTKKRGVRIPVYGNVAAGIPLEAVTDIEDWEEIDENMAAHGEFIALRIHGKSMEPRILDGDVVIVKIQSFIEDGDIGIIFVNSDDATCKKIKKTPNGIMLISNNPAFEPMFYSNEEIENLPVRVLGKVVELRGKF